MGSGAGVLANMNGVTRVLAHGADAAAATAETQIAPWPRMQIACAKQSMLADSQENWNVGTNSYKDVLGKPDLGLLTYYSQQDRQLHLIL